MQSCLHKTLILYIASYKSSGSQIEELLNPGSEVTTDTVAKLPSVCFVVVVPRRKVTFALYL